MTAGAIAAARAGLTLATLFAASGAAAQTLRCESADGTVTYANVACPAGSKAVRSLAPVDAPTPADVRAARERAAAQREQVRAIEARRQAEEQERERQRAAAAKAQAKAQDKRAQDCRRLAERLGNAEEALRRATIAKREAAAALLDRLRSEYAAQCRS